jgi:hypothetical protein
MPSVRRLTAILAADVAGYSWLMGADEEGTHERLRAHLRELVAPKIAEHRGRTVKNTGDGFLASTLASRPPFSVQTTAGRTGCEARTWRSLIARSPDWSIGRQRSCGVLGEHCITPDRLWASVAI